MSDIGPITRRSVVTLIAASGLSACASPVKRPNPVFDPIGFPGGQIPLAVNKVEITVRPRPNSDVSPADADFVVPPEQIARLWPRQRIIAAGGQDTLRYVIDDASAVSRTSETGEVVVATIQVRLIIGTLYGVEAAGAGARVDSEVRFEGFPSLVERQEALHRLSQDMAAKLDAQLAISIRQQLGAFVKT